MLSSACALCVSSYALPGFDPFSSAAGITTNGTAYANGSPLYHQTNAFGEGWALWNGGNGSSANEVTCVNSNLPYSSFPTNFPPPSGTNAILVPGLAQGQNSAGYSASLTFSRVIAADPNNLVTNKIYASFLLDVPSIGDLATTGTEPIFFSGFNNSTAGDTSSVPPGKSFKLFLQGNSATAGSSTMWDVGIADNSGGSTERFDPTFRAADAVLFVVVDYEFGINGQNDNANIWVNPAGATFGAASAPASTTNITITAASGNEVGQAANFFLYNRGGATLWGSILLSDLRIGTTWSFVTGGPEFTLQPAAQSNNMGATVTLSSAAVAGGSTVSYQWRRNGVNLTNGGNFSGVTSANLVISNATSTNSGTYSVLASDSILSITSTNAVLMIGALDPVIAIPPQSQTVYAGNTAQFSVTPEGTSPFSYFWQLNGVNLTNGTLADGAIISGTTTSNLTISHIAAGEAGSYTVAVTNIHGAVTSAPPAVLTVLASLAFTSVPQSRFEAVGDNLAFSAAVNNSATFQWQFDGMNIAGATGSSLDFANIQTSNAGTYSIIASNASGAISNSVTLAVSTGLISLQPTNLIVARIGDGVQSLSGSTGNTIYLDQIATNGTYVSTMMVPNSGPPALIVPGTGDGIYEGVLTLSANGQFINFAGYNVSYPYAGSDVTAGGVTIRGIGAVNGLGYYALALTNIGLYSGGNHFIRSAASTDGLTNFWTTGAASGAGIKYIAPGLDSNGQGIPAIGGGGPGTRVTGIFGGSVCFTDSENNTSETGVNFFSGLPNSTAPTTLLFQLSGTADPNDFAISPDGNTVYIADDNAVNGNSGGGIQRWDFNQVQWNLNYVLGTGSNSTVGARGLTVDFNDFTGDGANGTGAIVYATTAESTGNRLIRVPDTGAGSQATVLTTAGPNQMLRGVRFGPVAAGVLIQTPPQSESADLQGNASFSVSVSGSLPISYQWQLDGSNIAGATGASLALTNIQLNSAGTYTVLVSNALSTASASAVLSLLVNTNAPMLIGAGSFGLTEVEASFSAEITAQSATNLANYTIEGPGGEVSIFSAAQDSSGSNVFLTVSTLSNGASYTITASNLANAFATNNILPPNSQTNFIASAFQAVGIGTSAPTQTVLSNGYTISAVGALLNGTNDSAAFSGQLQTGNFDVCVCLASLGSVDVWTEAGLMARQSLAPGSPFAAGIATPGMSGCFFDSRSSSNGSSSIAGNFPANFPNTWLRLTRTGAVFTGYASYDGETWTQIGAASISMTDPIYVGLTLTSNNTNDWTTAQFINLENTPTNSAIGPNTNPNEGIGPCSRKTGIVISEIMYKPAPRDDTNNCEYLEIYNTQPYFHDISGYQITCADMNYTFPSNTTIAAGAYIVIAASPGSIQNVYGITNVMGPYDGSLKKSETLQLLDEQSNVLLTIPYSATYPWPVAALGTGHSIVLANPSYGEGDPRAWAISDIIGGSPGTMESYRPSPLRNVCINEFLAHSENPDVQQFIELYNHSTTATDVSGCILTDVIGSNLFVVPQGTVIGPGGFVSFDQTQLGFTLNGSGDTIYFINPAQTRYLDAVQFEPRADGVSFGRWPDGANDFYPFTSATPGTNNSPIVIGTIVINELMYDPITTDDAQFIELYNNSTNTVSVANWQFTAGVTFTFPTNAVIGPYGFVVVGKNIANLFASYTNLNSTNTFGNYSGKLSHDGERVALSQPETYFGTNIYVVEDEVTYGTGGRWGQWSSGSGSSLELIDPHANHRLAANWTDSDDTKKSQWVTISNTGVLDNGTNYTSGITYAQVGLLDAGECLVDNVQVIFNGTNLITNSTFENGLGGWIPLGDHVRSSLEPGGYQSSQSLHLRSSDKFWHAENSCEILLPANNMTAGSTVTLQFQARWLHGWWEPILHLDGNWLEAYGAMPVPSNLGGPGQVNSTYATNAGPAIYNVKHTPSLPAANQAAVVTAQIHDPDGVSGFTLYYRIDPSSNYTAVPMLDNGTGGDAIAGDGIFSATIPGQAANTVVAFYLSATDSLGATTRFPALRPQNNEPVRECIVLFGDNTTASSFGLYHHWLTQTNIQRWINLADLSNEYMDGTFVNNTRVIYNMQGRFATSPAAQSFNSPVGNLCTYEWEMPADDMFLGATSFHKIHVPGNGGLNDYSLQREQTSYTFMRALRLPWLFRRNVVLYVNGNRRGPLMEDTQLPDSDMVKEYFSNDDDGYLYKFDQWYEFAAQPSGVSISYTKEWTHTLMPYTTTGGVKKVTRYRPMYQIRRTPDSLNDFTNIFSLVDAASSYGTANYVANMENLANMENWLGNFAVNHAVGNWDVYSAETGQNLYGYIGAAGTKCTLMMWDMNIDLGASGSWGPGANLFTGDTEDPNTENILNCPTFRRMYWRTLETLINGQFSDAGVSPLANAKYQAFINDGMSPYISGGVENPNTAMLPWIAEAQSSIASQLSAVDATQFSVNSNVVVSNDVAYVSGIAPVAIDAVWINGVAWPITWTSLTGWTVAIPLQPGANLLNAIGVTISGQPIAGATGSASANYPGAAPSYAGQVVINEIMYNPIATNAEYVELFNNSTNETFNLSGWQLQGINYTFPAGSEIAPNQFLILAANSAAFAAACGATIPVFDNFSGTLAPPQLLNLIDASSNTVAEVYYENALPWPTGLNPGVSLELKDPTKDNWREGNWAGVSLSPGATNTVFTNFPAFQPLWINEVLADNRTSITNSAGQHAPWIEIYNPSASNVSLNGLYLTDNYSNLTQWAFPSYASINAGEFLVVFADGETNLNSPSELHAGFALSPGAGSVALSRLYNGQPQVLDYIDYTNLPPNYSYGSLPDGQSFVRQQFFDTTPGAPNNPSLPGVVPYFALNSVYTQNFDSLPNPGSATVNSDNPVTINGTTYTPANPLNFAAAVANGGLGLSSTMPGWYGSAVSGMKLGASAGDQSTGGVISFGPTTSSSTNRALGLLATSSTDGTAFGVAFLNETTNILDLISLNYIGELWRQEPSAKILSFSYYLDPTGTNTFSTNGTQPLPSLNVSFPTGAFQAEDGTQPSNQIILGVANQAIPNWNPGGVLWLVWQMTNNNGNSQGLAIDNLTFSAGSTYVPPSIVTQPQSQAVNSGNNPQFSVVASSAFPISYQWQKNSTNLSGQTNSVLQLNDVGESDQASYDVVVSNEYGATNSATAVLTVNLVSGLPVIDPQPLSQSNSIGSNAVFFIGASGVPPLSYEWFFNGAPVTGATNTSLVISNLAVSNAGTYWVEVTDTAGSTNSQNAILTVLVIPPSIITQPVSQTVPSGATVQLTIGASGTGPLSYQWMFGATALSDNTTYHGSATSALTINNVQTAQTGSYTVVVTNSGGSIASQPAIVSLIGPSYVAYTNAGAVYTQNFDSLPDPGSTTVNTANPVTINSTIYTLANPVDFAYPILTTTGGLGLSNTMPGWYGYGSVAMKFGASAGDQSTGGIISFGATTSAATNRSLGLIATSTSGSTAFAVRILNQTLDTLTNMSVSFTGALWRQQTTAKSITFYYYVDVTGSAPFSVNNITSDITNLNVSFPTGSSTAGTSGPILTSALSVTNHFIANCPPGAALWLTWAMTNSASGGQGLGIDNFSFSATGPQTLFPYLTIAQTNTNVIVSWPAGLVGYALQFNAADLSNSNAWQNWASATGSNAVTIPASNSFEFFRLKR